MRHLTVAESMDVHVSTATECNYIQICPIRLVSKRLALSQFVINIYRANIESVSLFVICLQSQLRNSCNVPYIRILHCH
jgi:hypothetical protein